MIICVQCGAVKRETNGWLSLWVSRSSVPTLNVRHMEAGDNSPEFDVVCGENCCQRRVQQFLDWMKVSQ